VERVDLPWDQLKTYRPPLTQPEDFWAFWESGVTEARRQPLHVTVEQETVPFPVRAWRVAWEGFRGGRLQGRLVMPVKPGPHPAVILLHGYGWFPPGWMDSLAWAGAGLASFAIGIRGQDPPPASAEFPGGGGWLVTGLGDPEHYYYRTVYLDCLRAFDVLAAHAEVDRARLGAVGLSQGGGLALVLAALAPELKVAVAGAPFMAHIRRAVDLALDAPYDQVAHWFRVHDPLHRLEDRVYQTLSYFDVMNFAPRITAPTVVGVGLLDRVCPPSTGVAVAHHLAGPADLWVYPESGHDLPPPFWDEALRFVATICTGDARSAGA
jgi:cephalosporin-C deacetylase